MSPLRMGSAGQGRFRQVLLLLGWLTVVALLFSSQMYVGYRLMSVPISFRALFAMQIVFWYLWSLAGPVAWSCATRWPVRGERRWRHLARHVVLALAVSTVTLLAYSLLYNAMLRVPLIAGWFAEPERARSAGANLLAFFAYYFHIEVFVYVGVVAVAHAVHSNRELDARERETLQLTSQLATARLQVLTAQLQPHFLFNTLHTIGSFILQRKNERAMEVLAELGELLRITLTRQSAEAIPLSEELDHLKRYLRIEEARFGDRLTVQWEIEPAARAALVPPLILQPLVENAIKHGVSARIEPATLVVRARTFDDRLRISVRNDGPTLPPSWALESSSGYGLRNVHERLQTRGGGCTLRVENVGTRGVLATIEMPALTEAVAHA